MEIVKKVWGTEHLSGYLSGLIAGLAMVLSAGCVQRLGDAVPPFQLNAARYFAQVLMSSFIAACTKKTFRITLIKVPWVVLLTVLSVLDNTFYFTSAQYLPLGNLTITYVTLLYIGTVLLSKLFLDRDIHLVQIALFVVILIGQFLLLQPYSTEGNTTGSRSSMLKLNGRRYTHYAFGYALVIGSSMVTALKPFVYRIQLNEVPTSVLSLWVGLMGFIASLLLMISTEIPVSLMSRLQLFLLAGHAILASISSILVSYTQQVLNPVVYGILMNMQEVFGFILQYSLPQFLLAGHRNVIEGVGASIVMLGILVYVFTEVKIKSVMSLDNM